MRTDLHRKQSFVAYNQIFSIRIDSDFVNAKLIRTGWDDGIFDTRHGFYRHDPASVVPAGFAELSATDREKFKITINQDSVKQMKDTVCYYAGNMHRCLYTVVPVTLNNQSADTLSYINMSCSWLDIFTTNAENVRLIPSNLMDCFKNSPSIYKVAPYQQVTFYIPVYFLTDTGKGKLFTSKGFKIGMSLYKDIEGAQLPFDMRGLTLRRETDNVIWSNEIVAR
ncbi:hypothetical protein ACFFGT_18905 [Mucilaginibacter angelicae]|uniref:Uncharacterized protein n=1 Tax=Mucilaginibacter angelicae TaxID=869718 RepID=A0ABV6L9Z5_9SPHI